MDRLSDDQLRSIREAVRVLIDEQHGDIPELHEVTPSLSQLLEKVESLLNEPSAEADAVIEHDRQHHQCTFYFLNAQKVREEGGRFTKLPEFSELLDDGWLVQKAIQIDQAHLGHYIDDVLAVSHSWECKGFPDTTGVQWRMIQEHLKSRAGRKFKLLWVDFPCMPQGSRTPYQRATFHWMLKHVNALYLGGTVLILLDSAYMSKFWTQFEAWLSMQRCTSEGLEPALHDQRWQVHCIHNATTCEELEARWIGRTPEEAMELLGKPDVTVTNTSDKTTQLAYLKTLNEVVCASWDDHNVGRLCCEAVKGELEEMSAFLQNGFSKAQLSRVVLRHLTRMRELDEDAWDLAAKFLQAGFCQEEELASLGIFAGPDVGSHSTLLSRQTLMGHDGAAVACLAFSATNIFSGGHDHTIRVWDLATGKNTRTLTGHGGEVFALVVSQTGPISGSNDKTIKVWDANTGKCTQTLTGHEDAVMSLAVSVTNLVSGSYDRSIKVWDRNSGECVQTLTGHTDVVRVLAMGTKCLFSGSRDNTIRVWEVPTWQCRLTFSGHEDAVMSLVANHRCLFTGSRDTTIKVWDLVSGKCCQTWRGHTDAVRSVVLGLTNLLFSASHDNTVRVWDVNTGQCLQTSSCCGSGLASLAIGATVFASGNYDGKIQVWEARQNRFWRFWQRWSSDV